MCATELMEGLAFLEYWCAAKKFIYRTILRALFCHPNAQWTLLSHVITSLQLAI